MQVKLNLACIFTQWGEGPGAVKLPKRPLDQLHGHLRWRGVAVLSGEGLLYPVVIDLDGGDQAVLLSLAHLDPATPWQKRRVILHLVNQTEHLLDTER